MYILTGLIFIVVILAFIAWFTYRQYRLTQGLVFVVATQHLDIRNISANNPNADDVTLSANQLEKISLLWKYRLVDIALLESTYSKLYVDVFEEIYRADIPNEVNGKTLLVDYCPTTLELYREWYKHHRKVSILA